tara:strand:+ start:3188 stop:4126 length:939 start_codon:yes stop_codon:yes gene_type:complete
MATSTNPEILNGHSLNADQWSYGKTRVNKSGGKNVPLRNAATKKTLYLSTPLMLTWGVNENDYDGSGKFSYDMSLQFPREQDSNFNDATKGFLAGLQELEAQIKADAIKNSKDWFNKSKMSAEVVDALWSPMLKYPKNQATGEPDTTRAPTLRVKLPFWDEQFTCELYDTSGQQVFPDESSDDTPKDLVQKGQNVALVIECGGIWFANGKFGVTWRLLQAVLQPKAGLRGKCHIALDGATKQRLVEEAESFEDDDEGEVEVVDSDEDVEEEEDDDESTTSIKQEVAAEVKKAPKVVKKVVKKRGRKPKNAEA